MAQEMDIKTKLSGSDQEKLAELGTFTYKQQGVWFLNAFWEDYGEAEKENVWNYVINYGKLDLEKGENGCALDELNAHRFLEANKETLTVREMREKLRSAQCIATGDRPKLVPLCWFLMFKYNVDWHELVNRSQGDNSEKLKEAQARLDEVSRAFDEARARADEARARADEAKAAENEARAREDEALEKERPFKEAQEELEAALADVKAQEDAYNARTEELKQKSETGGVVSRNKASQELAIHLSEDPLPLRKAKITVEAATKRAEKARAPFLIAREAAEEARRQAEAARMAAEEAKAAAEAAMDAAAARVKEAEDFLESVKNEPGQPMGAIWWVGRELEEKKKYLPTSKGGTR